MEISSVLLGVLPAPPRLSIASMSDRTFTTLPFLITCEGSCRRYASAPIGACGVSSVLRGAREPRSVNLSGEFNSPEAERPDKGLMPRAMSCVTAPLESG
eukprot:1527013-Pyramimonas_sp.AAC.1